MARLTRYEQETVINFNAGEPIATVCTKDKAVMRKLDKLVKEFPEIYKQIGQSKADKVYSMPKAYISYRKPRKLSEEQRESARERMKYINGYDN